VLSLLLLSTPVFVIATLLTLAATRVNSILGVQVFEYIGETSSSPVTGWWNQFIDRLQHLVLPSFTLALLGRGGIQPLPTQCNARRARPGLHPHRPSQGPDPATGAVQTRPAHRADTDGDALRLRHRRFGDRGGIHREKIFGWHGMGEWVVQGIATQDTNIIAAVTVFTGAAVLLAGLLSDVHLRRTRPKGEGVMTEPITTESATAAKSGLDAHKFASRRTLVWRRFLTQQTRRSGTGAACVVLRRLLRPSAACCPTATPTSTTTHCRQPPSPQHWFGTNALGQDLLALTLRGMEKSMPDRRSRGADLDGVRRDGRFDRRLFRGWRDRRLIVARRPLLVVPASSSS
jgi:hypothetical protein